MSVRVLNVSRTIRVSAPGPQGAPGVGATDVIPLVEAEEAARIAADAALQASIDEIGEGGVVEETDPVATAALDTHKADSGAHASLFAAKQDAATAATDTELAAEATARSDADAAHAALTTGAHNLTALLAAKAGVSHSHVISDVTGLQAALDALTDPSELATAISAAIATHAASDATDAELTAAIASEVANRDTAISAAVASLTTAINLKQDASTAATDTELTAHTSRTDNPHSVTKSQVGLGSVDNTADTAKPVSTAQQTALDAKVPTSYLDTDGTLAANSDTKVATQKATKTYVDSKVRRATKRVVHVLCGPGQYSGSMLATGNTSQLNARQRGNLPVTPTRYRLRMRNYSTLSITGGTAGAKFKGAWIGEPSYPTAAGDNRYDGSMAATGTNIVGTTLTTVPNDGTDLVSAWIDNTAGAGGIVKDKPFVLSTAFINDTGGSITTYGDRTAGWAFFGNAGAGVSDSTIASATAVPSVVKTQTVPFDIRIEYEYEAVVDEAGKPNIPVGLFIGDSITYGQGTFLPANTLASHQDETWVGLASISEGFCPINAAIGGTTSANWVTNFTSWLSKLDLTTTVPDFAYLGIGVNDAAGSVSAATMQANIVSLINSLKGLGIKRIYLGTMTPGGWAADVAFTAGVTTSGSAVITGVNTLGLKPGMAISGTGIPGSTTILTIDSPVQVTMSANATASATVTVTVGKPATSYVNSAAKELVRTTVNKWIGFKPMGVKVWDFDAALRMETNPGLGEFAWIPSYPHPEVRGYQRMATVVNL